MSRHFGYHGCYLRIDLSSRQVDRVEIPVTVLREYIGGSGLGTWLLLTESPCATTISGSFDPLAPERPFIIAFSPLVGTPLTTSAKFAVLAQSPLTQRINDSLSSSAFAIAGKKTGYDAIVVHGRAESPTCIVVESTGVRFEPAADLWGLSAEAAADRITERLGRGLRVAAIGPAGENLVRFATLSNEGRHAGRGGLGAVLGSKQIKAIAVRGDCSVGVAHPEELIEYARQLSERSFGPATSKYRELGTVSNLLTFNRLGTLPTRNFQQSTFAEAERLAPETMTAGIVRTRSSCAACTIGCEHIFHPPDRPGTGVRMEYENLFALGPLCGISDPAIVLAASAYCDAAGLDTISAGVTVAFAMECAERGLIDEPQLQFGSGDALLSTLRLIAAREGLGELLAQGVREAARQIGRGADEFAMHVKGLELPGYEPRALQTMALGFAVGARGADHNRSGAYQVDFSDTVDRFAPADDAVFRAIDTEDEAAVMDSLILCKFLRGVFSHRFAEMAEMLRLVTGWGFDAGELREAAGRIVTAKKRFNMQEGWTPAEDALPARFHTQALPDGAGAGAIIDPQRLNEMIRQYNLARGWSAEGWAPEALESSPPADLKRGRAPAADAAPSLPQ